MEVTLGYAGMFLWLSGSLSGRKCNLLYFVREYLTNSAAASLKIYQLYDSLRNNSGNVECPNFIGFTSIFYNRVLGV
jgi:hypothetical protein